MQKVKHAEHHRSQSGDNREIPTEHRDTYEQWRVLLEAEHIIDADGMIDVEKLEKRYPDTLSKQQIVWIEAMQKGEVIEEGDDVELDEPEEEGAEAEVDVATEPEPESEPEPKVSKKTIVEEAEESVAEAAQEEKEEVEEEEDEDLAPPPPPGSKQGAENKERPKEFAEGDSFNILIEEGGEPEEVTVVKITKDGIHLASSLDESTEYLVDQDELREMIVD